MSASPRLDEVDAKPADRAVLSEPMVGGTVRLEPMRAEHARDLYEAARLDEGTWRYLPVPPPKSVEDVQEWMSEALAAAEAGEQQPFIVRLCGDKDAAGADRVIGSSRYMDIQPSHRTLEVGWTWLAPDVRGGPVNVEMKLLMLGWAFEAFRARRVTLKTDHRNLASRRAIEKLGASCEGILRQHRITWDGSSRDTVYYGIVDHEWPAVRAWLEHRLAVARSETDGGLDESLRPRAEAIVRDGWTIKGAR